MNKTNEMISFKSIEMVMESAHDKDELARAASFLLVHSKKLTEEEGTPLLKLCLKKGGSAKRMAELCYAPSWWAKTYLEGQFEKSWDEVLFAVSGLDEHDVVLELFDKWCHSKWGQAELERRNEHIRSELFSYEKHARILLKIEMEKSKPFNWLNSWCAEDVHISFLKSMHRGSNEVVLRALEYMSEVKKKSIVDFQQALKKDERMTEKALLCIALVENHFLKEGSVINKRAVRAL
jgi:hypothetical protein